MNRRELMKFFGIGAAIAPIVNGTPALAVKALILEPPKVELIPAMVIEPLPWNVNGMSITLEIHDPQNNRHWSLPASEFEAFVEQDLVDVTNFSTPHEFRDFRPSRFIDRRWVARGQS